MSVCENCGLLIEHGATDSEHCLLCEDFREKNIRVSPLSEDELELVLAWRSHPDVYQHFRQQDAPLDWASHVEWFDSRTSDRHDFIIRYNGRRVGGISLSATDSVGVYLGDFSAHGQGIGTATLTWLCRRFEHRAPLFAEIHRDNEASIRLFERCGFEQTDADGDWLQFTYEA